MARIKPYKKEACAGKKMRKIKPSNPPNIPALMKQSGSERVLSFVRKTAEKMGPTPPKVAKGWVATVLVAWCGQTIFEEIKTSGRKIELVWRVYHTRFFGYGVIPREDQEDDIVADFRDQIREELRVYNHKTSSSRKKHEIKKKGGQLVKEEVTPADADTKDPWSLEGAKLWNEKTARKNVDVKRLPTVKREAKKENHAPRRVSNIHDIITIDDTDEDTVGGDDFPFSLPDEAFSGMFM